MSIKQYHIRVHVFPPDADLSTTIYFTTDLLASGFQQSGNIVIRILNHQLLNLFVREVFHRGFAGIYRKYVSLKIETDPLRLTYLSLQNEGMVTRAAYEGIELFPQIGEIGKDDVGTDYDLLDKPDQAARLHGDLNQLLREADSLEREELKSRCWQLGGRDRAYYAVGAHTARQIGRQFGRHALIETIKNGPDSYLRAFNSVAESKVRIIEL